MCRTKRPTGQSAGSEMATPPILFNGDEDENDSGADTSSYALQSIATTEVVDYDDDDEDDEEERDLEETQLTLPGAAAHSVTLWSFITKECEE